MFSKLCILNLAHLQVYRVEKVGINKRVLYRKRANFSALMVAIEKWKFGKIYFFDTECINIPTFSTR